MVCVFYVFGCVCSLLYVVYLIFAVVFFFLFYVVVFLIFSVVVFFLLFSTVVFLFLFLCYFLSFTPSLLPLSLIFSLPHPSHPFSPSLSKRDPTACIIPPILNPVPFIPTKLIPSRQPRGSVLLHPGLRNTPLRESEDVP